MPRLTDYSRYDASLADFATDDDDADELEEKTDFIENFLDEDVWTNEKEKEEEEIKLPKVFDSVTRSSVYKSDSIERSARYKGPSHAVQIHTVSFTPDAGEIVNVPHDWRAYLADCLDYVQDHYTLGPNARIRVHMVVNGYHQSSERQTLKSLSKWIMTMKLKNYDDGSGDADLNEVEISWYNVPTVGCGLDIELKKNTDEGKTITNTRWGSRSLYKSYSHDTKLCGAISLVIEFAHNVYRELMDSKMKATNLTEKIIDKEITSASKKNKEITTIINRELDAELIKAANNWRIIKNNTTAKYPKSKTTRIRHQLARDLQAAIGMVGDPGATMAQLGQMVDYLTTKRMIKCGLRVYNEKIQLMYTHPDKTTEVREWYNVLLSDRNHCQPILHLSTLINEPDKQFCEGCGEVKFKSHTCKTGCKKCKNKTINHEKIIDMEVAKDREYKHQWISCEKCNFKFVNDECLQFHLPTCCKSKWRCLQCFKLCEGNGLKKEFPIEYKDSILVQNDNTHDCENTLFCTNCKKWCKRWPNHKCYLERKQMKAYVPEFERNSKMCSKILYCDFEATQDFKLEHNDSYVYVHEVNLVCTQEADGVKWPYFETVNEWLDKLLTADYDGYTVVFHNGSGYDNHHIIKALIDRNVAFKPTFTNGTKIKEITIRIEKTPDQYLTSKNNHNQAKKLKKENSNIVVESISKYITIRVIDSLSFLLMPLKLFPKTFGLKNIKKGDYCHLFNTSKTINWIGKLKDMKKEIFDYSSMNELEQKHFDSWFEYCKDLTMKEHKTFFEEYKKQQKKITPGTAKIESYVAKAFKLWVGKLKDIGKELFMYSRKNNGEQKEFDAWYNENQEYEWNNKKELVEYCDDDVNILRLACEKFRTLSKDTSQCDPFSYSTAAGYSKAIFMANHLPEKTIAALPRNVILELTPVARGGRTDCNYIHWKASNGQKGYACDFVSLYPSINKFGIYPKGHPTVEHNPEDKFPHKNFNRNEYIMRRQGLGILWVNVVCPQDIYFPVLHGLRDEKGQSVSGEKKQGSKLMFDLADKINQGYTSLELKHAIKEGYKVTFIHKIYWWQETVTGVFSSYVDNFFKIKTEADSWPDSKRMNENVKAFKSKSKLEQTAIVNKWREENKIEDKMKTEQQEYDYYTQFSGEYWPMNEQEKQDYLTQFEQHHGFKLDPTNMNKNEGLRTIAKLNLNSLWGKMGERLDYDSHVILYNNENDRQKACKLKIADDCIKDWKSLTDDCDLVILNPEKTDEDEFNIVSDRNIVLAIFTTAQARLKLLREFLEPLNYRVLYYDTDSVYFFVEQDECPETFIKLDTMLGCASSEIGSSKRCFSSEKYIVEFTSGGGKNYGYLLNTGETNFKCKGINTRRMDVQSQLSYETAKKAILADNEIEINIPGMLQRPQIGSIVTIDTTKTYRNAWTKGEIVKKQNSENIETRPWRNETMDKYEQLVNFGKQIEPDKDKKRNRVQNYIKQTIKQKKQKIEKPEQTEPSMFHLVIVTIDLYAYYKYGTKEDGVYSRKFASRHDAAEELRNHDSVHLMHQNAYCYYRKLMKKDYCKKNMPTAYEYYEPFYKTTLAGINELKKGQLSESEREDAEEENKIFFFAAK